MNNVKTKTEMYALLANGVLGNTVPQWFDVDSWMPHRNKYKWWGVRTLTPGGPCWLNVWMPHVPNWCHQAKIDGHRYNISPMVDRIARVTMWANVWDSPTGLVLECFEYPPIEGSWRELMPTKAIGYTGVVANQILKRHLNANSLDDLEILLERYPNHVVELSALETCFGTVPGRNAVIWEVRNY